MMSSPAAPWFVRTPAAGRGARVALVVGVSAALLAMMALAGGSARQLLFVPVLGVAVVSLVAGIPAGLITSGLSLAGLAFFGAGGPPWDEDRFELGRLIGVGVVAVLVSWATGSLRSAYQRAAEERSAAVVAAEQLAREKARAESAVRMRDEVLSVVSHDLKNPLATIQVTADLLERRCDRLAPELSRHARTIQQNVAGASRLIADLLDAASIEAGRLSLRPRAVAVETIARDAIERMAPLAQAAGLALELHARETQAEVTCDTDRVLQVLSNLIGNAVKVTPPGGTVGLSVEPLQGEIRFTVSDTGCGVDPEDLPHLFDRFRRGRSAAYKGSGLGLAIARGLVEAHGGAIGVDSAPGQGARFWFTLPLTAGSGPDAPRRGSARGAADSPSLIRVAGAPR
jgi:signal transduction histidine kinase